VADFDARYPATLQLVKGTSLRVASSSAGHADLLPERHPPARPAASFLDAAIALEMKRAGVALK
jgi:hypothetical protein